MQGKTNEAALEYRRILRDFSDQTPLATLSRQNLTGMGMTPAPAVSVALQTQKDLLAKQIALAEQDLTDTQRLAQTGVVPQDKTRAAEREVLRLKQQLAALDTNNAGSPDSPFGNSDANPIPPQRRSPHLTPKSRRYAGGQQASRRYRRLVAWQHRFANRRQRRAAT